MLFVNFSNVPVDNKTKSAAIGINLIFVDFILNIS
jgi:hypothetical protein